MKSELHIIRRFVNHRGLLEINTSFRLKYFKVKKRRRIQDFPGAGVNPKGGTATYYLAKRCRKLHGNEENWTERFAAHPKFYHVDPPL